jgi:hypothetical protein
MKKNQARFPNWIDLLTLWLGTHWAGTPVVVFCGNQAEHVEELQKHFEVDDLGSAINAEYSILPCAMVEEAIGVCNTTPDSNPFAVVWDGKSVVHENT